MATKNWSNLAGLCSAHGVNYTGEEDEKGLSLLLTMAKVAIPKQTVGKKEAVKGGVAKEAGNEDLKAQLDEKGIKYHHKAGEKKLKQLLADV